MQKSPVIRFDVTTKDKLGILRQLGWIKFNQAEIDITISFYDDFLKNGNNHISFHSDGIINDHGVPNPKLFVKTEKKPKVKYYRYVGESLINMKGTVTFDYGAHIIRELEKFPAYTICNNIQWELDLQKYAKKSYFALRILFTKDKQFFDNYLKDWAITDRKTFENKQLKIGFIYVNRFP